MAVTVVALPSIVLQPSASHVIHDVSDPKNEIGSEDIYVSFYGTQAFEGGTRSASLHGHVRVSEPAEATGQVELEPRGEQFVASLDVHMQEVMHMACPSLSIPSTRVLLPSRLSNTTPSTSSTFTEELAAPAFYSNVNKGGIGVFAVSTDEKRLVVGSRNGECRVVEIVDCGGQDRKGLGVKRGREVALRGHVGDITAISCFPSNQVVVTASTDMSLRIFSMIDGSCPRHLSGHTDRVTGVHVFTTLDGRHKGREILSASLDCTLRLWSIPTGDISQTWRLPKPISALLVVASEEETTRSTDADVLSFSVALVGFPDGTISRISLSPADNADAHSLPIERPLSISDMPVSLTSVECLAYDRRSRLVAAGHRNGFVSLSRVSMPSMGDKHRQDCSLLCLWRRTQDSSVNSIHWSRRADETSLLVAGSDGLPYRAVVSEESGKVKVRVAQEFVGLNSDPCTGIVETRGGRVWTSGGARDSSIRVYEAWQ